jgi:hypothetical protein
MGLSIDETWLNKHRGKLWQKPVFQVVTVKHKCSIVSKDIINILIQVSC